MIDIGLVEYLLDQRQVLILRESPVVIRIGGLEGLGTDDNFYSLGGHSLLGLDLVDIQRFVAVLVIFRHRRRGGR